MNLPLVLGTDAQIEYDEAQDWYEQRQAGLGTRFMAAVEFVFDRIRANPRMHSLVLGDIRRAVVKGFPYCVYYAERQGVVVVVSVFNTSRNPTIWQSRADPN